MTAFRQVVAKLQDGQREEALIGLEFVLRLDPAFAPAANLQRQLTSGASEIDLSDIISQLQAPTTDAINEYLVEAVDDFNQRRFVEARDKVEKVLADLPGHPEARQLAAQIGEALKVESQVGQFLAQAREALDLGDPQEAANFVMMAQALDPHHAGIDAMLAGIRAAGGSAVEISAFAASQPEEDDFAVSFATLDDRDSGFAADLAAAAEGGAFGEPSAPAGAHDDFFAPPSAPPLPESGGFDAGPEAGGAGDLSDLFDVAASEPGPELEAIERPPGPSEEAARIEQLLATGQAAFDRGDFQEAIDAWSRIYLVDPSHELAQERVDEARRRKEEIDRRVEHMLYDAQEAAVAGETEKAARLLDGILTLQPNHLEAIQLRENLSSDGPESGAVAAAPAMPDLSDDLFDDNLPAPEALPEFDFDISSEPVPLSRPKRRHIPMRQVTLAIAALAVVLLGVWFGSQLLGSRSEVDQTEALNRTLVEAEALFKDGRVDEAIALLQEFPATGLDQSRIAKRLARYQQALAPPTPTPIPETLVAARQALDEGRLAAAYWSAMEGLKRHSQDEQLLEIRAQILAREPRIGSLYNQVTGGDSRSAVPLARELVAAYPDSAELAEQLDRALFNGALSELRAYNLAGGEVLLRDLERRQPDDAEVARTLDLIEKYKSRPVDPLMETYIASLSPR